MVPVDQVEEVALAEEPPNHFSTLCFDRFFQSFSFFPGDRG